jgi:hypothetical protein
MKNIILIFVFVNIIFGLNAQSPTGTISSASGFTVDPLTNIIFTLTLANEPSGYTREIFWTGAGIINQGTNGLTTFITQYKNQSNNPVNDIAASVTYTIRDKNNKITDTKLINSSSTVKTVTVRFIGSIASMNMSGDVSENPSNNSTLGIPCGTKSLDISVPTPATDPNVGVTYTWSLPSGWSGSSTSNTISTSTNAGQTNGAISVVARRTDGTFTQSYSVNVTRPRVGAATFTSFPTANVCHNSSVSVQTTATNVTTYNWTTTGSLELTYTYNWLYALMKAKSSGSSGTVTLTVDNTCLSPQSVTRTIYVGGPVITSATVNWQPLAIPNYINNPGFLTINVNNAVGSSTNWTILNGAGNIYDAGQNQVSVYAYPFMRVEGVTSNQCGKGEARTFYVQNISGGYYRMTSPNPTPNLISMDVLAMNALKKVTLVSDANPGIVRMYNANGSVNAQTHRDNNLLSFDVNNLPRGRYYLNFSFDGNKNFTEQIDLN